MLLMKLCYYLIHLLFTYLFLLQDVLYICIECEVLRTTLDLANGTYIIIVLQKNVLH